MTSHLHLKIPPISKFINNLYNYLPAGTDGGVMIVVIAGGQRLILDSDSESVT